MFEIRFWIGEEKETGDRSEYVTYLYNHLGSTTAVTDESGMVVEAYAYGAYGELLTENPGTRRFLYNGQYGVVTDENGLYHMRARYYNTDIKRFISRDIVSGDITNSQSLNRYCYVQGNPLSYIDPFGLSPESGWGNVGHAILEVLGFIPGWGMIADAVNAIWYAAEGRWMDAAASLISIIPGIGDVIGSSMKSVKAAKVVKGLFYGAGAAGNLWLSGNHISDGVKNLKNALNGEAHEGGIIDNALEVFFGFVNTGLTVAGLAIGLKGLKKLGDATPQIGGKGGKNSVETPYGKAIQSNSKEAIQVKDYVENGGMLYRGGTLNRSKTTDAQFWAPESPLTPGYAEKYGVDFNQMDYIIGGYIKKGTEFITRPAPGLGNNAGGAIEIVTPPNSVDFKFFYMIGE